MSGLREVEGGREVPPGAHMRDSYNHERIGKILATKRSEVLALPLLPVG